MNWNHRHWALLITIFALSNVVLLLYAIHLGGEESEEYVVEMAMVEDMPEEIKEILESETPPPLDNSSVTHQAQNETAKSRIPAPEPLETLEDLMASRGMSADETSKGFLSSDEGFGGSLAELAEKRKELKERLKQLENDKKNYGDDLKASRTTISYSLIDRRAYDIPPPIYTCLEGGKVVVNIKVSAVGKVTEVSFNEKSSTTSDYCLVENAMNYAKKAWFDESSKSTQIGTITYYFQPK